MRKMKERYEEARAALVKSQEKMKRQTDRNSKEAEKYRVGILWLACYNSEIKLENRSGKNNKISRRM